MEKAGSSDQKGFLPHTSLLLGRNENSFPEVLRIYPYITLAESWVVPTLLARKNEDPLFYLPACGTLQLCICSGRCSQL